MTYELKLRDLRDEWKEVGEYKEKVSVIRNMINIISENLLVKATGLDANTVNEIIDLIGLYPEKTDTEIAEMVFENLRGE